MTVAGISFQTSLFTGFLHSHFNKCMTPRVLSSNPLESSLYYLGCLPFDRKFCKFRMEGKWPGEVTCWKYQPKSVHSGWCKPNGSVAWTLKPISWFLLSSRFMLHKFTPSWIETVMDEAILR